MWYYAEVTALTNLRRLAVTGLSTILTLPHSMSRLTALTSLDVDVHREAPLEARTYMRLPPHRRRTCSSSGERGFVTRRGQLLPQVELVLSSYGGWLTLCPWLLALPALRRLVLPKSEAAQALAQALRGEPHNVTVVLV